MSSSILRGRYMICSHEQVIPNGALYQEDGRIVEVGDYRDLTAKYRPDQELGSDDFLVIPGLVDSHHHGRGTTSFQLGVPDDSLEMYVLSSRASLLTDPYLDSLWAAIHLVESGVTTVFHYHATRKLAEYEVRLRESLRAYSDLGIRVAFAVDIRNQNSFVYHDDLEFARSLPEELQERMRRVELVASGVAVDRCLAAFDSLREEYGGSDRVRLHLAPLAPQWCTPEVLRALKKKADDCGTGLHTHVLETPYQRSYGWRQHGKSLVEYLRDMDMLGPNVCLAHAVWVNERDLEILAETGTSVAHNPSCNLRLKSGIAPVLPMLAHGINVGIGTDSDAINDDEDMLQEVRLATKLHRLPGIGSPSLTSREAFKMATSNGARITGFGDRIGALESGKAADATLLRIDRLFEPYLDPGVDMVDAFIARAKSQDVDTVVVGGEPILQGGKPARVDKAEIAARLRENLANPPASAVAEMEEKRRLLRDLQPFAASFYRDWLPDRVEPFYRYNSRG